ncbi:unnamed protein product [Blepharisma stoltei]|uniref:UBC core domain-containing protein n=1 Tax=Blepharisma stoltei TaxID=1481888 RepID=A0AAU9IK46_9CILI|nr:unnamed protein product [Blepharisma stoltei]
MSIRIIKEIALCKKEFTELGISFWPNEENDFRNCTGVILGPENSPYEGGMFFIKIVFPEGYPMVAPKITFMTKIYNPCIDSHGQVDLCVLHDHWSPALTTGKTLLSIMSLLTDFSADDPLVPDIAHIYKSDRQRYESIAREWTRLYAL